MTANVVNVAVEGDKGVDEVETVEDEAEVTEVEVTEVVIVVVEVDSEITILAPITTIKKALDLITTTKVDLAPFKLKLLILTKVDLVLDLTMRIAEEDEVDTGAVVDAGEAGDADVGEAANLIVEVEVIKGYFSYLINIYSSY